MFRAGSPVTAAAFLDRRRELTRLGRVFDDLLAGAPRWLAVLGPRKIGKTSLILEASRRAPSTVPVALLDVMAHAPLSTELFRTLTLRALDALVGAALGGSLERRAGDPPAFGELLRGSDLYPTLPKDLRTELDRLVDGAPTPEHVGRWLALPERVAQHTGARLVVAIDEVQELAALSTRSFEPFPVMRAAWQTHERVAYVISGSAPTALRELVTSRHSPFFQHFDLLDLGPFEQSDAIALLRDQAPADRPIAADVAEKVVEIVGRHPFYLQVVGDALTHEPPPYDIGSLKPVLQSLLFSRSGRLSLYFENEYQRLVGRATTLAATLEALATSAPLRLTDLARAIGASTASTARYVDRVGDAVVREGDLYALADPLFATWLRWRAPGGTVVPMTIIGDEAEIAVAAQLAGLGFDLVYQSRGSRGAFDLLAIRGSQQLGVQVKRERLPLRFSKTEWARMDADARRWGWRHLVAQVSPESSVRFLDPARARVAKEVRLADDATIENVLAWVDAPAKPGFSRKRGTTG